MTNSLHAHPFGNLSPEQTQEMLKTIAQAGHLLEITYVRQFLAETRLDAYTRTAGAVGQFSGESNRLVRNAVSYNASALYESVASDRPQQLINPVLSIERVFKNRARAAVLDIGPRSEMEIFCLLAAGFAQENIKAIDLVSYSPYVTIGDMHAIPFPDASFDVILSGWVIPYSRDLQTMAQEMVRVARGRGIIAIAADYSDPAMRAEEAKRETASSGSLSYRLEDCTSVQSTQQILDLFDGHVGQIFFRHDPERPQEALIMTVFEVLKSS